MSMGATGELQNSTAEQVTIKQTKVNKLLHKKTERVKNTVKFTDIHS